MGTGPVLVSYLHTVEEAGAVAWEIAAGSTGSVGANSSRVPWLSEEALVRCWDEELWPS